MTSFKVLGSPDLYTVGWIVALSIECATAMARLDERYNEPCGFLQHQIHSTLYTWGKMGEYNIVTALFPTGLYGLTRGRGGVEKKKMRLAAVNTKNSDD